MSALFSIIFVFLFLYSALLLWLARGFILTTYFHPKSSITTQAVSIIICARNEEKNIRHCLNSILKQEYSHSYIQLILVNDASNDETAAIANNILKKSGLDYLLISNSEKKGKKKSISNAMTFAKNELIITRDADTFTTSPLWLKTLSDFQQTTQADFVIAPIALADNFGILWALQAVENNILALMNCGSAFYKKPFLCNGANLLFTKSIFEKANGYVSHIEIASGDDVLFLEDVKKIPGSTITYLKSQEAMVHTFPCYSFGALLKQKTRWASKFKFNKNVLNFSVAFLSLAVNLFWVFCLVYGYIQPENNSSTLIFVFLKIIVDILMLFLTSNFIKNRSVLWFALPVSCIYPVYACVVGFSSVFFKPTWK